MPHIEYVREAGSEGIELVMWLIMRGALADCGSVEAGASLLSRARVEHGRRAHPDPGERRMHRATQSTHQGRTRRRRRVRHQAPRRHQAASTASRSSRWSAASSSTTTRGRREVRHRACRRPTSPRACAQPSVDAVILCTPTQMHAAQAIAVPEGRQARAGRDPARRQPRGRRGGGRAAEGDRPGRHGRPHAPLQSEPPVGAQAGSSPASSTSSRWTCRPISSAAPT